MQKFFVVLLVLVLNFTVAQKCFAESVMYNTKTHKYHKITCVHAAKCTVNCIRLEKADAKKRGGIPCKVCGG